MTSQNQPTFPSLYTHLFTLPHPIRPPGHATDTFLTAQISSLRVHPTLEAALHLLNGDLPSAHFLVRHMQAAPAHEGMLLHGILHRMEGDYDNARAWFRNVGESEVFRQVWGGGKGEGGVSGEGENAALEKGLAWVGEVEGFVKRKEGDWKKLERKGREEVQRVVEFCRGKFGDGVWEDARGEYSQPEGEHKKLGQEMVTGEKGFRKF
ncbi:MAG: hypothetical protein MMC23_001812 [Stictis urceolatum]|nr:hypothetical protein [Stictis urceolata]